MNNCAKFSNNVKQNLSYVSQQTACKLKRKSEKRLVFITFSVNNGVNVVDAIDNCNDTDVLNANDWMKEFERGNVKRSAWK